MNKEIIINEKTLIIIVVVVCMFLAYVFWRHYQISTENQELREGKRESDSNYLKLLEEYLHKTNSVPSSIRRKLDELKATYAGLDKNIEAELVVVMELLDSGKETIAVEKLTKIIENVLKQRIEMESEEKTPKRRTFMEAIKEAVKLDVICERLGAFMNALRVIRNEEAHQMNIQLSDNETLIYLLTGIHILYELAGKSSETSIA